MSILTKRKQKSQEYDKHNVSGGYADVVNSIYKTNNYELFSPFEGNRRVKPLHVDRLEKSFLENYLPVPIVVDESYRIGDGQNRFEACKNLDYPVYYIIIQGLTLKDVQRLNANVKPWSIDDYLDSFISIGENNDYFRYRRFKEKYGLNHNECLILLTSTMDCDNTLNIKMCNQGEEWHKFKDGLFKIPDLTSADHAAHEILRVGAYYEGFKRRSFVYAMINCFKNKEYCHDTFLKRLSKQSAKLTDQAGVNDYLKVIEGIYNFRSRNAAKIRLF